jgi:Periplasmic component of the Tol biopolymer transport system
MKRSRAIVLLVISFLLLSALPAAAQRVSLVSRNSSGTASGNGNSYTYSSAQALSHDGRFIVFPSYASDLVAGDINNTQDIFMRDTLTGVTSLVSVNYWETTSANSYSMEPAISGNGRFVAFHSSASDLVRKDANRKTDLFVRDMQTGVTTLIKPRTGLTVGFTLDNTPAKFSADSSTMIFSGRDGQIYAYNLLTSALVMVHLDRWGFETGGAHDPAVSADGRFVTFVSPKSLTLGDTNHKDDVFVRDLGTGELQCVSVNPGGTVTGNDASVLPPFGSPISDDGRFIAFISYASNLVSGDNNTFSDIFVRDIVTGTTTIAGINEAGLAPGGIFHGMMSADGRFVAILTSTRLTADDDNNNDSDIYVRDLVLGRTTLVTANIPRDFNYPNQNVYLQSISPDGRFVSFTARNINALVDPVLGTIYDIYLRDVTNGVTTLVTRSVDWTGGGNETSSNPVFSPDGQVLFFMSRADNLVFKDTNAHVDVFTFRLE